MSKVFYMGQTCLYVNECKLNYLLNLEKEITIETNENKKTNKL